MARRMPYRQFDDNGPITEYVMVVALKNGRPAVLQRGIRRWACDTRRLFGEHRVPLDLTYEPSGACERVSIRGVVIVVVRKGKVRDVGRRVANFSKLRQQWFPQRKFSLSRVRQDKMVDHRTASGLPVRIRNSTGVPYQSASRMSDQKARYRQIAGSHLFPFQAESGQICFESAAIKHVQPDRPGWLCATPKRRCGLSCLACDGSTHEACEEGSYHRSRCVEFHV